MKKKKESSFFERNEKELLALGMPRCSKCGFIQQYKGQTEPHYYTCPLIQEKYWPSKKEFNPSTRYCRS